MLSYRRQRVLSALIEEYISRALPVGSRTLTERYQLGVSPATVRNDLSALEDAGYITQPHTSVGRIPTDAGYRAFVDDLLASGLIKEGHPYQEIVNQLRESASEIDELMEKTSAALARLTDCLSVVVGPSLMASHIRQLSLISLTNYRGLIVLVSEEGQVANRQITFQEEVEPDHLAHIQNLLCDLLVGKTPADVREERRTGNKDTMASQIEELQDPLVQFILDEIYLCLTENNFGKPHRLGLSSLLRQPEFKQAQSLLPIMEVLEDEDVFMHVFDDALVSDDECVVLIGRENNAEELAGVSVVAGQYGRGDGAGIVAVIGPTRMDYTRVIRAVRAARQALQGS